MGLKRFYQIVFVWYFLQESCNAVLFENYFKLSYITFVKNNSYVGIFPEISLEKCALLCASHAPEPCGRFIWKTTVRLCMLHSKAFVPESVIALENKDQLFIRVHTGCQAARYVYNFEANTCIRMASSTGINWFNARAICQRDGGDLIVISNKLKWNFVVDYVQYVGVHWIGLKALKWVNGDNFVNNFDVMVNVNNYDGNFPDDGPSCGSLRPLSPVMLHDESCLYRLYGSFLCEIVLE